jgi:adenine-specific DNA methylase
MLLSAAFPVACSLSVTAPCVFSQTLGAFCVGGKGMTKKKYTFIDLFAGLGGFRLALESLGAKCVYSNEWDKYSQQTYFANFGEQPDGDITKVEASSIPDHDIYLYYKIEGSRIL